MLSSVSPKLCSTKQTFYRGNDSFHGQISLGYIPLWVIQNPY